MSVTAGYVYDTDNNTTYNNAADWAYPDKENIAIFGPVLLPKVYGSNLSELEIASDGMISLTINSVKALLVDEVGDNYQVEAQSKPLELTSTEEKVVVVAETIENDGNKSKHSTTQSDGFEFVQNVRLGSQLSVESSLDVKGETRLQNRLSVTLEAGIEQALKVGSNLSVAGMATLGATLDDEVHTSGTVQIGNMAKIAGAAQVGGTLSVQGEANLEEVVSMGSNLSVADRADFSDDVQVDGDLSVKGSATIDAGAYLGSTLEVTGQADLLNRLRLNGTLSVLSAAGFDNKVEILGELSVAETADIVGKTQLGDALSVAGETLLVGNVDGLERVRFESTLSVKGEAKFVDVVTLGSNLSVGNRADFGQAVQVGGILSVTDAATIQGTTTLENTLSVGNSAHLRSTVIGTNAQECSLSVNGTADFRLNTRVGGQLSVDSDATISGNLSVVQDANFTGAVSMEDTLIVSGEADFISDAAFAAGVTVEGETQLAVDGASDTKVGKFLSVGGGLEVMNSSVFKGDTNKMSKHLSVGETLEVAKQVDFKDVTRIGSNLSVEKGIRTDADVDVGSTLQVGSDSRLKGSVVMDQTLSVKNAFVVQTGNSELGGTLSVTNMVMLASAGDVTTTGGQVLVGKSLSVHNHTFLSSNLSVGERTWIGSELSVGAHSYFASNLDIGSRVQVGSNLSVAGQTTLGATMDDEVHTGGSVHIGNMMKAAGAGEVGGTLSVSRETYIGSNLSVEGTTDILGATQIGSILSVTGATDIVGAVQLGSNLSVTGTTQIGGATDIVGITQLGNKLSVEGEASFKNKLSVAMSANFEMAMAIAGQTTVGGELSVGSNVAIMSNVNIGQRVLIGSNLSVAGQTTLGATMDDEVHTGGTVHIGNMMKAAGAGEVGGTLSVSQAVNFQSTLSVVGTTDIQGATRMNETLSVKGVTDIEGATRIKTSLSVEGPTELMGTLSVYAASHFQNDMFVDGRTKVGEILSVGGVTTIASNLFVAGPKFEIPVGTVGERPTNEANYGLIYYNESARQFQGLAKKGDTGNPEMDNVWIPLGGYKGVNDFDGDTFIRAMDENGNDNDTISFFAGESNTAKLTMTSSTFDFNLDYQTATADVKLNSTLSVTGEVGIYGATRINGQLSVNDNVKFNADTLTFGATKLGGTLSVNGHTKFNQDVRMNLNTAIFQVAQHDDHSTYLPYKSASNIGSIIYDKQRQIHMGLQGANEQLDWKPIGGMQDGDADTYIAAERGVGTDNDTLDFYAGGTMLMEMSNDALKIIKQNGVNDGQLSVGGRTTMEGVLRANSNVIIQGTLSVQGSDGSKFNGPLEAAHNVVLNAASDDTTLVKGLSTFENNVTVSSGKNLYAETVLASALGHYTEFNGGGEGQAEGTLDMFYENVKIHGDLDIMGQINQSATSVTELYVEDKSIVLGASSSSEVRSNSDGTYSYSGSNFETLETSMHESGLTVNGIPGKFDAEPDATKTAEGSNVLWEKSLMWNIPMGVANVDGTSNLAMNSKDDTKKHLEPFWEFKGGQLRITSHTQNDLNEYVSFAFRINSLEQLELVKLQSTDGNTVDSATKFKTIAKFGNVVAQSQ